MKTMRYTEQDKGPVVFYFQNDDYGFASVTIRQDTKEVVVYVPSLGVKVTKKMTLRPHASFAFALDMLNKELDSKPQIVLQGRSYASS